MNDSTRRADLPMWYRVLRAAALPFLVIGLVGGLAGLAFCTQAWVEVNERPPEGHAAGFVGLALMMATAVSAVAASGATFALWTFWRPRKNNAE
ncbi:hypothetical protein [Limnoglobus roseus]|uniref:Uncharacterized protein n=1 Tax=Limnoglobus roseus TaxID=2598579 RepID=A0A5C1A9U2_9BACT|nr:hypothetical protein [Limnoglobus roseus]QEL15500.1 hypothetical protein PX52LOC_02423 [Limnoglobus roseus]